MDNHQYSLSKLRDIVLPDPPPLWPPAAGAWVALGMVVIAAILIGMRLHTARRRNAYRRAGLLLLSNAETAHDVSVTLKRVALAVFPRDKVASLYGDDWAAFLHETCPSRNFASMVKTDPSAEYGEEIVELAGTWIRQHRVPQVQAAAAAN